MATLTSLTPSINPWQLRPELCREVTWLASNSDDTLLCGAEVDGQQWSVVLNPVDSPSLYALYVGNQHVLDFEDWPGFWRWPS